MSFLHGNTSSFEVMFISIYRLIGRLHVGDQILVVDGVGLLDVTHQEAVSSLMRAMSMESVCLLKLRHSLYIVILPYDITL